MESSAPDHPRLSLARDGDALVIRVGGWWNLRSGIPPIAEVDRALEASSPPGRARVEADGLDRWDSSLALVLARIERTCRQRDIPFTMDDAMPAGLRQLVAVADGGAAPLLGRDVPSDRPASSEEGEPTEAPPLTEAIGSWAITWIASLDEKLEFLGSTTIALGRMLLGRTRRLGLGFGLALQQAGVETLPVLALFAMASGAVLSMLSTQQLCANSASAR